MKYSVLSHVINNNNQRY